MSRLEKLMIQGIRSFSPNEKNVIEFQSPLTIIVGANGTGKTTIIECLKFSTTGDMPPNSRGGAFVYDPKLAKEINVKAEVKLRFYNNKEEVLICSRTIQSSVRKVKSEQKTLECSLSKEYNGSTLLVTSKIADIDKQMPEFLGVSHSILDNVIFCHQDESVWPIGDPTVMKKKLDEIFSSTKYNKALLGLKASKKEINTDLKLKTQQLSFLLKEKIKKDDLIKKIKFFTEEIDRKGCKVTIYTNEIEKTQAKIETAKKDVKVFEMLENNYKIMKTESENSLNFIKNFPYKILENLNKAEALTNYETLEKQLYSLNKCNIEDEFLGVETFRQQIVEQQVQNERHIKVIDESEKQIEKSTVERKRLILELTSELKCTEKDIKQKIQEAFNKLENEISSRSTVLNRERENLIIQKNEQKNFEKFYNESMVYITKYKKLTLQEIEDFDIKPIDYSIQVELEATIDELLEDLNEQQCLLNEAYRTSDGGYKRNHLIESIKTLKKGLSSSPEDVKAKIDAACIKRDKSKGELKRLFETQQRNMVINEQKALLNSTNIKEIVNILETLAVDNSFVKLVNSVNTKITSEGILEIKNKLPTHILTINDMIDITAYENDLMDTRTNILTSNSASKIYNNFVKIGDKKMQCPLCSSAFNEKTKEEFDLKLNNVIKKIPSKVESLETKKNDILINIEHIKAQNDGILEMNKRKIRLKTSIDELATYEPLFDCEITQTESTIALLDKLIEPLMAEMQCIQNNINNIKNMTNELESIPKDMDKMPLEDNIRKIKIQIESKRSELTNCTQYIKDSESKRRMIEQYNEDKKIILKRDDLIDQLEKMEKVDLKECEDKVKVLERKYESSNQKFMKAKMVIDIKIKRIEELDLQIDLLITEVDQAKYKVSDMYKDKTVKYNGAILTYYDLKDPASYENVRTSVILHKNKIIKLAKDIELQKYEIKLIDENMKLKRHKEKAISIEEELKKFDSAAYTRLKANLIAYEDKKTKLLSNESIIKGEVKQIAHSLKNLNIELKQYKESNKQFLTCSIEIRVLELSLEDLDKCINGLDKAIVDFHCAKIDEVNRTLKELWMNTYKGNDIDFIELKAESSDTRAYNYRLVMVKNGIELDMRGRSSAGQKMISSILFRIALADSFSLGCNVFALDEPTTNLDIENIQSLANTLAAIIKNRKHAQFIVITHDEEFVQLLNREGTEYYYRITRDVKGNSHIQRHSIYK